MALPKLDVPVNLLTWEVSLPDRLEVKQFGGNALAAELFPAAVQNVITDGTDDFNEKDSVGWSETGEEIDKLTAGQVGGVIVDPQGAVVPGANITVINKQTGTSQTTQSDGEGHWVISGVQPGPVTVTVSRPGFANTQQELTVNGSRRVRLGTTLQVAAATALVTVTSSAEISDSDSRRIDDQARKQQQAQLNAPSQNVFNLRRRVAGILPVHVDVPRSGKSYRFVRPLVLDEETKITFQYKSK